MSSTNRSNARKDHVSDYYITPQDQIELFLKEFEKVDNIFRKPHLKILDCCAGGDIVHEMSYPTVIKKLYGKDIDTIDIREDSRAKNKFNYLDFALDYEPDVIITNPPFNKAIEIINAALDDVTPGGYVIMLLRLNFFGSDKRFPFFQQIMPRYCFVHHKRMSFTDDGKTDSIEYCHMIFIKDFNVSYSELRVI